MTNSRSSRNHLNALKTFSRRMTENDKPLAATQPQSNHRAPLLICPLAKKEGGLLISLIWSRWPTLEFVRGARWYAKTRYQGPVIFVIRDARTLPFASIWKFHPRRRIIVTPRHKKSARAREREIKTKGKNWRAYGEELRTGAPDFKGLNANYHVGWKGGRRGEGASWNFAANPSSASHKTVSRGQKEALTRTSTRVYSRERLRLRDATY